METASPNPFVSQNGSELFRGGPANGQHRAPAFDDSEDFGPETDVDMVDDVLLSPAIAAAKALVQGQKLEDDLERQRQQLSDYDDPADLDRSRDTPTPPAHEVASGANADTLAESGGEESEEEWNYIPGKDNKPDPDTEEQDDMSSQLNPNAAEFVPVSPTRQPLSPTNVLILDDAIISASPRLGFEKSMDNIQMPSELEFNNEISQRPGDLELANGPSHGDDYFMRDNFSTLRNKAKDFNVSSTCAELGDSINSFTSSMNSSAAFVTEDIPFDKLETVQNIEEKVTSGVLEKANLFGINNDFSNKAMKATNIFGKSDPMTTSVIGDFTSSPDQEDDMIVPDTPKSTVVEAPVSPSNENISPITHQTELESPTDDYVINTHKSPELMSPEDNPQEGLVLGQERTSSSGFESESGTEEGETNVPEESSEGFITEHRRSPPLDLNFKPIQTFSDTNPFGALQSPSSTTPLDHFNVHTDAGFGSSVPKADDVRAGEVSTFKPLVETPKKEEDRLSNFDILQSTPSSFISVRQSLADEAIVPFDALESPKEIPHFEHPPNANSTVLNTELPQSPETEFNYEERLSPFEQKPLLESFTNPFDLKSNVSDIVHNIPSEETCLEESSFSSADHENKEPKSISHVDLDTTAGFVAEEIKILQDEQEFEQTSKLTEEIKLENSRSEEVEKIESDVSPRAVDQVLAAFDDIKDDHEINETKPELEKEDKDLDLEQETKEMKLEFESHIADSKTTPDELNNIDDGFEVISKDELTLNISDSEVKERELHIPGIEPISGLGDVTPQEAHDMLSPSKLTDTFMLGENINVDKTEETKDATSDVLAKNDFLNAINGLDSAFTEDFVTADKSTTLLSSPFDLASPLEPQATKTVSYQTLTPADEPKLTKTETYITGIEELPSPAKSPFPEEVTSLITEETLVSPVTEKPVSTIPEETVPAVSEVLVPQVPEVTVNPVEKEIEPTVTEETIPDIQVVPETNKTEDSPIVEKESVVEVTSTPVEAEPPVAEDSVLHKSEPVQSQVVTETLITNLEETSDVPSAVTTEVPSTAGTPPPTPAPGLDDSKEEFQSTDILVAAVAAAGAVAAGTAVVAEKEVKKAAIKPAAGPAKKPDSATKAPSKAAPAKAPASKPATQKLTTTTKPTSAPTKPGGTTAATKSATTKTAGAAPKQITGKPTVPSTTAAKKPAAAAPAKTATTKTVASAAPKTTTTTAPKSVPNKLAVSKTSTVTLKPSSKPTTPTSKPTTPTTPKSPSVTKVDAVKSPPRPAARSTLTAKPVGPSPKSASSTGDKPAEKKPLTNGDIKSLPKKEVAPKKPATTTSTKPAAPAKTLAPTAKAPTSTLPKTTAAKTGAAQPKPKPTTTTTAKPAPIKRPATAPAAKTTDKTGKEAVNKQISNMKPAVNGKTAPAKTVAGVKKTDPKANGKVPSGKPAPIKKPEEVKKEEEVKESQIQECNITTTNGFAEHVVEEHESVKIEELSPVIVDGVN